jgi:ABC-2 type transport system ATP-binding protein
MSIITFSHLRKTYGKFVALDDFSLEIPQGCVFGLLGPNGAGKSTTFKCLLGLLRATSGEIRYNGARVTPATFDRIAYVPERSVLYDWMLVSDHVAMQRQAFKNFDSARAVELLGQFGVDPRKRVRALSKGMKTATMVALALARNAETLILDEPTSGLDPVNQRTVLSLIINEAARGCSIVFSSHQIGQVERAAEQIAILDHGRLVLEGSIDDLKADRKIVEGILPSPDFALNGFANDPRITRLDRTERIVRLLVREDPGGVADTLALAGAAGVRTIDLNLEDIFLYAVAPYDARASVVVEARS